MKLNGLLKTVAMIGCVSAIAVSVAACDNSNGTDSTSSGKTHDPITLEVSGSTGTYEPHNFVDGKCTMCDETTIFTQDTIAKDSIVSTACDQQGTVVEIKYQTTAYGEEAITKTAWVYLPYGYDATDTQTKYNVLYLVHGSGLNEGYWFAKGSYTATDSIYQSGGNGTTNVLDTLMKDGTAEKSIVVTPTFYMPGEDGATVSTGNDADTTYFADELKNDLMPYIAENYNTYAASGSADDLKAARDHQGYAGLSLGSMISFSSIWISCLEYVSYIGSFSGAVSVSDAEEIVAAKNSTYADCDINYWYVGLGTSETSSVYPGDPFGCYRTIVSGVSGMQPGSDIASGDNCEYVVCNKTGHNYQSWITALYNCLHVFFKA